MKNMTILLALLVGLGVACKKNVDSPASQDQKTAAAPSSADERSSTEGKTLGGYLEGTKQIKIWQNQFTKSGIVKGQQATISLPEKVNAILQAIDPNQEIQGHLARCPADFTLAFLDAAGEDLGSIGICGGIPGKQEDPFDLQVRFDSTRKNERGGIDVPDGKALMSIINERLAADEPTQAK